MDKALYFMMQTSETDYEREKWIQSNWPIYDIKGKTNVYVAMGKHIHSYNVNGELLKEFSFEKATKWVFCVFLCLKPSDDQRRIGRWGEVKVRLENYKETFNFSVSVVFQYTKSDNFRPEQAAKLVKVSTSFDKIVGHFIRTRTFPQ